MPGMGVVAMGAVAMGMIVRHGCDSHSERPNFDRDS